MKSDPGRSSSNSGKLEDKEKLRNFPD